MKISFAEYHIDNTDSNFLEKYWDYDKNTVDPWKISHCSKIKVWVKCQEKGYHGSFRRTCANIKRSLNCPYCNSSASGKVHKLDSFGYHNPLKAQSWHPDNDISPFRVALRSNKKFKFICENCGTKFEKMLLNITNHDQWCPQCSMSKGEKKIAEWLRYNDIEYEYEKTYDGLIGLGGGLLSYDFYLPKYNMLIEYQGEQHKEYVPVFHRTYLNFQKQLKHDDIKRRFAKDNYLKLIEISSYNYDNIDLILSKEI